jgi:chemotaxis protein CheX
MAATSPTTPSLNLHDFRRALEWSLADVFATMFNQQVEVVPHEDVAEVSGLSAIIGFGGKFSGFLALHLSAETACKIAEGLLGMPFDKVDDTVCDAVGEVANMLAGGLKKNVSRTEELFKLSIPSIIDGNEYSTRAPSDAERLMLGVSAGNSRFKARLVVEFK